MVSSFRRHLPALVSALLAIALYAVSVGGTYVFDDFTIFQQDPRLKDPSLWWQYWTRSYNEGVDNLYRPIVSMSYAIQWWLHGDRAWIFHLVNVLLHAVVTALVAEFAHRLINARAALVAGLLFAAHPLHVEAVANIVGRAELMCALGTLGALVLFTKPLTYPRALAITGCFVLALLSKEQGMLLPLLLLIFAAAQRFLAPQPAPESRQPLLLLTVLICWLLSGYIIFRESILKFWWDRNFLDWTINPMIRCEGADRWLMPLVLLGRYTELLVAPFRLRWDYGAKVIGWTVSLSDPYLYLGIAAIVGWVIVLAIHLRQRSVLGVVATLSLGATYGMVGNIVSLIGTNFAERLMYLPSAFFILAIVALFSRNSHDDTEGFRARPLATIAVAIILLLFSIRTLVYARLWNDRLSLYSTLLQNQPKSIRLYMLVASEYIDRGQLDEAARVDRQGREVLPDYWEIWVQSGLVAMNQEKFDEAEQYFTRAGDIRRSVRIAAWIEENNRRREQAATRPTGR